MRSRLTIDAYIITSFDEHQKEDSEGRLRFISGFSGSFAYAVVSAWIELSFRWAIKFLFSSDNFSLRRAMDVFKIFGFGRSRARLQHLEYLLIKRWFIGGVVVGGKIVLMAYTQHVMLFWFGIFAERASIGCCRWCRSKNDSASVVAWMGTRAHQRFPSDDRSEKLGWLHLGLGSTSSAPLHHQYAQLDLLGSRLAEQSADIIGASWSAKMWCDGKCAIEWLQWTWFDCILL